jgi:hypothetical protein
MVKFFTIIVGWSKSAVQIILPIIMHLEPRIRSVNLSGKYSGETRVAALFGWKRNAGCLAELAIYIDTVSNIGACVTAKRTFRC